MDGKTEGRTNEGTDRGTDRGMEGQTVGRNDPEPSRNLFEGRNFVLFFHFQKKRLSRSGISVTLRSIGAIFTC